MTKKEQLQKNAKSDQIYDQHSYNTASPVEILGNAYERNTPDNNYLWDGKGNKKYLKYIEKHPSTGDYKRKLEIEKHDNFNKLLGGGSVGLMSGLLAGVLSQGKLKHPGAQSMAVVGGSVLGAGLGGYIGQKLHKRKFNKEYGEEYKKVTESSKKLENDLDNRIKKDKNFKDNYYQY